MAADRTEKGRISRTRSGSCCCSCLCTARERTLPAVAVWGGGRLAFPSRGSRPLTGLVGRWAGRRRVRLPWRGVGGGRSRRQYQPGRQYVGGPWSGNQTEACSRAELITSAAWSRAGSSTGSRTARVCSLVQDCPCASSSSLVQDCPCLKLGLGDSKDGRGEEGTCCSMVNTYLMVSKSNDALGITEGK